MKQDSLGDRMKRYEHANRFHLPPKQAVVIRIDGRAFHTYTRGRPKPFDQALVDSMVYATTELTKDLMGFKLAYTQSDEASFLITDTDDVGSQGWFDYNLSKVVSISASIFTEAFGRHMVKSGRRATFDSRAFVIPITDAPNYFLWRQQDWARNSLSMLAQAHFSHKQLDRKNSADMHNMLHEVGVNWAELPVQLKNGTFVRRVNYRLDDPSAAVRTRYDAFHPKVDYQLIHDWLQRSANSEEQP